MPTIFPTFHYTNYSTIDAAHNTTIINAKQFPNNVTHWISQCSTFTATLM